MGISISARGPFDGLPIWGTSHQTCACTIEAQNHGFNIMAASSNLQRLDPPATIPISITNGPPTHFPIYVDPQSRKEYVICDLCGRELRLKNRKNAQSLVSHRSRKGCQIDVQRGEIQRVLAAVQKQFHGAAIWYI